MKLSAIFTFKIYKFASKFTSHAGWRNIVTARIQRIWEGNVFNPVCLSDTGPPSHDISPSHDAL